MRLPMGILLSFLLLTVSSCTSNYTKHSDADYSGSGDERAPASINKPSKPLTDSEIEDAVSSDALRLGPTKVIVDNDESFQSKIKAIESARPSETIRMVYYIYSDDHSSSYLTQKLIDAAKTGVKVKLMVDLITNYKNLDLFSYMQDASGGNIEVKLYGRPSEYVMRDALYLTMPCPGSVGVPKPTECASYKWPEIKKILSKQNEFTYTDFYSGLLLAGLYGKSATAAKVGINYGQQMSAMQSQTGPISPEQKAKLRELVKLVIDAKVFGKSSAYLKLGMAMMLYASDVNPVLNQIYGRFPFEQPEETSSLEHWEHITDYTHHKLLLVGDRFMQLGGRNIENSYHMDLEKMAEMYKTIGKKPAKYTFMDTDFAAEIQNGGDDVVKSYDNIWNYKSTVVGLGDLKSYLDNDFARNPDALLETVVACETKGLGKDREKMAECLFNETPKSAKFKTLSSRISEVKKNMDSNRILYETKYSKIKNFRSWKGMGYSAAAGLDSNLTNTDLSSAQFYYVENLPYKRNSEDRTLNFKNGQERENNKNIHALWLRGLENTCYESAKTKTPKRVILHSAYWFPATNMMETLGKMIDGSWDCSLVKVQIITNSFETTDLNILNVFARYQMKAFYGVYDNLQKEFKSQNRAAKFEYYEYKPAAGTTTEKILSLHTKLSILGDDVIIGSANADIRSYMMDTNNGVFIRNAREFVQDYTKWIDGIIANKNAMAELSNQFRLPLGMKLPLDENQPVTCPNAAEIAQGKAAMPMSLHGQDMCFLEIMAMKYKFLANMKAKDIDNWNTLRSLETAIGYDVYDSTRSIVSERYWDQVGSLKRPPQGASPQQKRIYEKAVDAEKEKIQNSFNRKYQTF